MDIYIDTREQSPLKFSKPYIEKIIEAKLPYGDYASRSGDQTCPVYFERKSLSDLFSTLGGNYKRFKKEINRCIDDGNILVIIIENTITDILPGYEHSTISGEAILRTLFTLMVKHKVPFVCCSSRQEMSIYISEFYYSWEKLLKKKESNAVSKL